CHGARPYFHEAAPVHPGADPVLRWHAARSRPPAAREPVAPCAPSLNRRIPPAGQHGRAVLHGHLPPGLTRAVTTSTALFCLTARCGVSEGPAPESRSPSWR